eukprot:Hpha_TRINITY_DN15979_c4_g10::TRINITY_DN15979_c4_g10_i1::g.73423::m.73423
MDAAGKVTAAALWQDLHTHDLDADDPPQLAEGGEGGTPVRERAQSPPLPFATEEDFQGCALETAKTAPAVVAEARAFGAGAVSFDEGDAMPRATTMGDALRRGLTAEDDGEYDDPPEEEQGDPAALRFMQQLQSQGMGVLGQASDEGRGSVTQAAGAENGVDHTDPALLFQQLQSSGMESVMQQALGGGMGGLHPDLLQWAGGLPPPGAFPFPAGLPFPGAPMVPGGMFPDGGLYFPPGGAGLVNPAWQDAGGAPAAGEEEEEEEEGGQGGGRRRRRKKHRKRNRKDKKEEYWNVRPDGGDCLIVPVTADTAAEEGGGQKD